MNTLKEQWEEFARTVLPKESGPVVFTTAHRSFYAGMAAAFAMQSVAFSTGDVEEIKQSVEGWSG